MTLEKAQLLSQISELIPTQKTRPQPKSHASLSDTTLFNILSILYTHDVDQKGLTVKQICDLLVDYDPEVVHLSAKLSNLVSAKLSAYVKRIERGEQDLLYCVIRYWSITSPKRMLYVYKGLLSKEYSSVVPVLVRELEVGRESIFNVKNYDNVEYSSSPVALSLDEDYIEHKVESSPTIRKSITVAQVTPKTMKHDNKSRVLIIHKTSSIKRNVLMDTFSNVWLECIRTGFFNIKSPESISGAEILKML